MDDGYHDINITDVFAATVHSGNNELAAYCANNGGGMFIDFGIYLVPKVALVASGSSFQYTTTKQNSNDWLAEDYNDASWNTGNAPFGSDTINGNVPNTNLNVPNLYLRSELYLPQTVYDRIKNGEYRVYMIASWDEDPTVYLNGTAILSETGWTTSYQNIEITNAFCNAVKAGTNILAASLVNNGGGQFIDFELVLIPEYTFVEKGSSFQYTTEEQNNQNWLAAEYNDSSWNTGNAPFGSDTIDGNAPNTELNVPKLYLRSSFKLSQHLYDEIKNGTYSVYMDISWDEDPKIYLNGTQILSKTSYTTSYETVKITAAFINAMQVGDNTLAAALVNHTGGQFLDFNIYLATADAADAGTAFSLEGTDVIGPRERIFYSLSYLVLTGSQLNGNQYVGNSTNDYTNWISSMSQCEMLTPYQYGSTQSNLIAMLKNGHQGVTLSQKEIQTIAAWIDLGVPYRGAYDESTNWGVADNREATEKQNKRDYYDALDAAVKRISTGTADTDALPITVSYATNAGTEIASVTDNGLAFLYPETRYVAGYQVTVTLPEGVNYFFLGLDSRVGEALIYCPSGTYTYTIPSDADAIFPSTFSNAEHPTITVRIATAEELAENRNLAANPYDVSANATDITAYPHASASTQYNDLEFAARNAIDGAAVNGGHGTYPLQSWGAAEADSDLWYQIDFGREVCVDTVKIAVRADWSSNHDTYFTGAVLEFSDGTTQAITLTQDADMQSFTVDGGPKKTSYVTIKRMETANNNWAGLSEVEVYGTEIERFDISFASMTMANSLDMNFAFEKGHADDWTGHYAVIRKTYADGREDVTQTVPYEAWKSTTINGIAHYYVTFNGIAAKEMTDDIYVTIYNAAGEAVSNIWSDSVRAQAMRTLALTDRADIELVQTMIVDMLYYGAAAQASFDYATDNLATALLTDVQKGFATADTEYTDTHTGSENYVASSLYLKSNIQLLLAFENIDPSMHATVTFTNHRGAKKEITIDGSEFTQNGSYYVVNVDDIVVADGRQDVTCTIYNENDEEVAKVTDSMESYVARASNLADAELFERIMKFSDSAYAYLHKK